MQLLEFLFAVGVTVALLSILSDNNPELFLSVVLLLLIAALIEMWGIGLVSIILVSFLLGTAALITVAGSFLHTIITGGNRRADQLAELMDNAAFNDDGPGNDFDDP